MSQETVEIVRTTYEAWDVLRWNLESSNQGDVQRALALIHPEIVVDATRNVFNPATYAGMEGLRQMQADTDEVWEEVRTEGLEFIDAGDRVVVIGRLVGKGKGSGVEVEQPLAQIITVHDGRVVRWEIGYTHRREALEAVGLSEQDAHAGLSE
jgi:ketosteroid isomerase-like protein